MILVNSGAFLSISSWFSELTELIFVMIPYIYSNGYPPTTQRIMGMCVANSLPRSLCVRVGRSVFALALVSWTAVSRKKIIYVNMAERDKFGWNWLKQEPFGGFSLIFELNRCINRSKVKLPQQCETRNALLENTMIVGDDATEEVTWFHLNFSCTRPVFTWCACKCLILTNYCDSVGVV